jgi:hypothetical protein
MTVDAAFWCNPQIAALHTGSCRKFPYFRQSYPVAITLSAMSAGFGSCARRTSAFTGLSRQTRCDQSNTMRTPNRFAAGIGTPRRGIYSHGIEVCRSGLSSASTTIQGVPFSAGTNSWTRASNSARFLEYGWQGRGICRLGRDLTARKRRLGGLPEMLAVRSEEEKPVRSGSISALLNAHWVVSHGGIDGRWRGGGISEVRKVIILETTLASGAHASTNSMETVMPLFIMRPGKAGCFGGWDNPR